MKDRLEIRRLELECSIGVYDWERAVPQQLLVDLDVPLNVSRAASSDNLADTLDYTALVDCVRRVAGARHYNLLETLAELMAQTLLKEFSLRWVRVALDKPAATPAKSTRIVIERQV